MAMLEFLQLVLDLFDLQPLSGFLCTFSSRSVDFILAGTGTSTGAQGWNQGTHSTEQANYLE
jgi:hypothetical protein